MNNYTPLSQAQCREALVRLQNYAFWMYNTPDGIAAFAKNETSIENRTFSLSVEPDGRIVAILKDTGSKVVFVTMATTMPAPANSICNIGYGFEVANPESLSKEDLEYGEKIAVFALSQFQRTQAFQFFSVMQPTTIDRIAADLSLAREPSIT